MTDELPPHLAVLRKVNASLKRPRPEMETVQTGSAPLARDPDPLLPVASDNETRWVSLAQAAELIAAAIPDRRAAENAIVKAALDSAFRLSCELMVVKKMVGGAALFTVKRPGDDAKLAERIDKAFKSNPVSNFVYEPDSGRISWVNVISGLRVVTERLLVDAEGVAAFYADPVLSVAPGHGKTSPLPVAEPARGVLPRNAKPADLRNEEYAHQAAVLVRSGSNLAQAIRAVAPVDGTRAPTSVDSGIRRTFSLMYDLHGQPLAIQK